MRLNGDYIVSVEDIERASQEENLMSKCIKELNEELEKIFKTAEKEAGIIVNELEKRKQKLKSIAVYYGYESQSKMLIEEMAELTKEISKNWRGGDNILSITEEIADVEIMLSQIKYLLHIEGAVEDWKKVKIARQLRRMEEEDLNE